MKKALILHGTAGSSQDNWFPWLRQKLEDHGYTVWCPDLPGADKPNLERYTNFILANHEFEIDSNTILIGHSSGALAILGLLAALPVGVKVKAAYLVGVFKNDLGWEALSEIFVKPFDFEQIRQHSRLWYFLHSDNDPYCPLDHAEYLHSQIGGDLLVLKGQHHFSVGSHGESYHQFPYLWHLIAGDVMTAEYVASFYQDMQNKNVQIWIDGGWAVDALLGTQTRPHGDLDIEIQKKDLSTLMKWFAEHGYWEIKRSDTRPHNFMYGDDLAHLVDVHVIEFDGQGNGIYGPKADGFVFPADALQGVGSIAGLAVKCIAPEWLVKFHTGYQLRDTDMHDVTALCNKFEIALPAEYVR